jgi:hypothetical protein
LIFFLKSSVIVAQMSNENLFVGEDIIWSEWYAEKSGKLAHTCNNHVAAVVCQERKKCDEADDTILYMTPGVHEEKTTDGKDQNYRNCYRSLIFRFFF